MENVQYQLTLIIYVWFPEQCSQYLRFYGVSSSRESTLYTNWKNRKEANCARRLWFKRHEMCSHSVSLSTFSDFPGLHDSHMFQQLKFSLYGCQPTAQSANVGEEHVTTRTSDENGVLAHSRALGKLDHQMHTAWNTLSLQDYLV